MMHIIPINDIHEHTEESTCKCHPFHTERDEEIIMVHNSFDGRELIEEGFQKNLTMNGVTTRSGEHLIEGDVIETVQGTKFYCINYFGLRPHIVDKQKNAYSLEGFMSPNIFKIGNLFDNPEMRNWFR